MANNQAMEDTSASKNLIIAFVFVIIAAVALIIAFAVLAYLTRQRRRAAAMHNSPDPEFITVVAQATALPAVRLLGAVQPVLLPQQEQP
jgi:hypothetical protein